ncbi:hypothetical protein XELAEV_18006103mg [Xenopus laevis]|uniref:Uncharacterized protein n=1 Tax=Xenopus laevis TaxID=8355 RepID=A0A974DZY6_XENLA|nr:hypothetical protein XELAEV_18006103mg [Xenopus laevis]
MDDDNQRNTKQGENFTREEISRILFSETYEETFGKLGAKEAYHELLRLRKKEAELHLHGVSLSDYYRESKIPRGFRLNSTPTLGRNNPAFCTRWCQILDRCSLDLMLLVIEEAGRELTSVRSELSSFEAAHLETLRSDKEADWPGRLQEQVGKYKAELLSFKSAKRLRVHQDYKEGAVYRWQQSGAPRRRRAEWRSRRSPGRSMTSGASESEEEAAAIGSATGSPQNRGQVRFLGHRPGDNVDPGRPPAVVANRIPANTRSRKPQAETGAKKRS